MNLRVPNLLSKKSILNSFSSSCLPPPPDSFFLKAIRHLEQQNEGHPLGRIVHPGTCPPWKRASKISIWWPHCRTHSLVNLMTRQVGSYPEVVYETKTSGWDPSCRTLGDAAVGGCLGALVWDTSLRPNFDTHSETALPGLLPWIQDRLLQGFSASALLTFGTR